MVESWEDASRVLEFLEHRENPLMDGQVLSSSSSLRTFFKTPLQGSWVASTSSTWGLNRIPPLQSVHLIVFCRSKNQRQVRPPSLGLGEPTPGRRGALRGAPHFTLFQFFFKSDTRKLMAIKQFCLTSRQGLLCTVCTTPTGCGPKGTGQ